MKTGFDVVGIAISNRTLNWKDEVLDLVNETAAYLKIESKIQPNDIKVFSDYVGEGYGIPTEGMVEAIKQVARTEGILLDPIYTGKAMAGLIDLIRKDYFDNKDKVLFWHTGGIPTLFTPQYRNLFV